MSLDDYRFNVEKASDIMWESAPLFKEHHLELVSEKVDFKPDVPKYLKIEELNALAVFTIRDADNNLIGYSYFMLNRHHHRTQVIVAENTLFFITKEHRKGWLASKFIKYCESLLFDNGVDQIQMRTKVRASFGVLLKRLKYSEEEVVYLKKRE